MTDNPTRWYVVGRRQDDGVTRFHLITPMTEAEVVTVYAGHGKPYAEVSVYACDDPFCDHPMTRKGERWDDTIDARDL